MEFQGYMQGARYGCAPPQTLSQRHKGYTRMAAGIYHIDRSAQLSHLAFLAEILRTPKISWLTSQERPLGHAPPWIVRGLIS
jgi:hypothetical protein